MPSLGTCPFALCFGEHLQTWEGVFSILVPWINQSRVYPRTSFSPFIVPCCLLVSQGWVLCTSPNPSTFFISKHVATKNGGLPLFVGNLPTINPILSCTLRYWPVWLWRVRGWVVHTAGEGALWSHEQREELGASGKCTGLGRNDDTGSGCSLR